MANLSLPARDSVDAQAEMFRLAEKDHQLSIPVLARRSSCLKVTTMREWKDGRAMPAWALFALGEAGVPDYLLTLVSSPFARCVVSEDGGDDADLDEAAADALEFASAVMRARSPASPGGVVIVPQEKTGIHKLKKRARASMRRAGR